jgi:serine O-acetyltransferase
MNLGGLTKQGLIDYTVAQLSNFFPDGQTKNEKKLIAEHIDEALVRLNKCINAVKTWEKDTFNYLHSSQYCTYLYFLSNTIWVRSCTIHVPTKIFLLNKLLNGIDLFYEISMPDIFFIGHSTGGKNHGVAPALEAGIIMYPNSAIIGNCKIGSEAIIAQGVSVIGRDVSPGSMVFTGRAGMLNEKPLKRRIIDDFFRFEGADDISRKLGSSV